MSEESLEEENLELSKIIPADERCSVCDTTFTSFKNKGRIGCLYCYLTFKDRINFVLKNIHGQTSHRGKTPVKWLERKRIELDSKILQKQLLKAIKLQEYEEAARLRDLLKDLNQGKEELE